MKSIGEYNKSKYALLVIDQIRNTVMIFIISNILYKMLQIKMFYLVLKLMEVLDIAG